MRRDGGAQAHPAPALIKGEKWPWGGTCRKGARSSPGGGGGLAGAGLTLPRTPYGPCRTSGCTAAAGPLDCSPSYRAPTRQEKAFGAGSPLAELPAARRPAANTETRWGGGPAGQLSGLEPLWDSRPRLQNGGLGSDLELPLPRIGASHKGWGGQWWRKGLHWPLSSQGGSLFPHRVESASLE